MTDTKSAKDTELATGAVPKVEWDDSNMKTSYANVCNASSTREEVTLLFGTNQTWHAGQKKVVVQLSDRLVLNPFAAKRLALMLNRVVDEYEKRFGTLELTTPTAAKKADA